MFGELLFGATEFASLDSTLFSANTWLRRCKKSSSWTIQEESSILIRSERCR